MNRLLSSCRLLFRSFVVATTAAAGMILGPGKAEAATIDYRVTILGSLPGGNFSNALAINSEGDVTGQTSSGSGNFGFLYKNGTMQELVPPAGQTSSSGLAINDSDQIAGFSANPAIWNGPNSPQTLFTNGIDAKRLP